MRSWFILGLVIGYAPAIYFFPYVGMLAWSWISYMNPHRLTFGAAYNFPVAEVIGVSTLIAWAMSKERKDIPRHPLVILLLVYYLWTTLTTVFSLYPEIAWGKWELFTKVLLLTFVGVSLMRTKVRLHAIIWVIVLSCGFFAVKGGLFTITTGGNYRVFGPPQTFHGDNNGIAVTFLMIFPLLRYLQMQSTNLLAWIGLGAAQLLTLSAVLGTHSRGGLVAMLAILGYMLIRARQVAVLLTTIVIGYASFQFMPEEWQDRQLSTVTMEDYQEDASAKGRITMWRAALNLAKDRPIAGGGFDVFYHRYVMAEYIPRNDDGSLPKSRASHSIYYEVLGEHGYVGLSLFLALGILNFLCCERIRRAAKGRKDLKWARDLATMLQVSLLAFAAGGAFLQKATFDLYYHMIALTVIAEWLVMKALKEPEPDEVPASDPILSFLFPNRKRKRPGTGLPPLPQGNFRNKGSQLRELN